LWVYLSKYKQSAVNKDLCTYCLQFQIILNCLITRKKLNKYIVCLWFLKELSEKRQAKIVRSAGIKMMNLNIFNLKKVFKMIKQIYEKEDSLSMLWKNTDSMKNLKKLIVWQWEEMTTIKKEVSIIWAKNVIIFESVIDDLSTQFKNLILSLQTKLDHIEQIMKRVMTTILQHSTSFHSYSSYSSQQFYSPRQNYQSNNSSVNHTCTAQSQNHSLN